MICRVDCSAFSFTTSRPENVSFLRSGLNQIAYSVGRSCFANFSRRPINHSSHVLGKPVSRDAETNTRDACATNQSAPLTELFTNVNARLRFSRLMRRLRDR